MAEGGTIGRANIELGVDTSKLDTGMSAAKEKIKTDVEEMQTQSASIQVSGSVSDPKIAEEEYRYQATLARLRGRSQSETTSALLEEIDYQNELKRINADVIAAEQEQARYQAALFAMRKEQLTVETQISFAKKEQEAIAKAEADAAFATAEATAARSAAEQQHKAAMESIHNTTKDVADVMPDVKPPPVQKQTWLEGLLSDSKALNKSMQAFAKLGILTATAAAAFKLGQTIRENVNKQLQTGVDLANTFRDSLNTLDVGERLQSTSKEVDALNEKIAAQTGSWVGAAWGWMQGESTSKLTEARDSLQADIGRMSKDRAAQDKAAKDTDRRLKSRQIDYDREQQRISRLSDERMKVNAQYALDTRKIDDEIAAEKDQKTKEILQRQKIALAEQYQFDMEEARKAHQTKLDEAQKQIEEEENARADKAKENREIEYQLMTEDQAHAARFLDEYSALEEEYAKAKDARDRELIRQQMVLRSKLFNKELADQQKELMKAQQEQFKSLRNDIAGLFNSQQLEIGINKLGSLLNVLIQKTGDNR